MILIAYTYSTLIWYLEVRSASISSLIEMPPRSSFDFKSRIQLGCEPRAILCHDFPWRPANNSQPTRYITGLQTIRSVVYCCCNTATTSSTPRIIARCRSIVDSVWKRPPGECIVWKLWYNVSRGVSLMCSKTESVVEHAQQKNRSISLWSLHEQVKAAADGHERVRLQSPTKETYIYLNASLKKFD